MIDKKIDFKIYAIGKSCKLIIDKRKNEKIMSAQRDIK